MSVHRRLNKDAPADGSEYVRQDGTWVVNSGGTGVGEAPSDGYSYARQDAAWTKGPNFESATVTGDGTTGPAALEIGLGRTGTGFAYVDLIGDTTYDDYGLRLIRGAGGANTDSQLAHHGTGDMIFRNHEAGGFQFESSAIDVLTYTPGTNTWDFQNKVITTTGTITGSNLSGTNTGDQVAGDFNHDDLAAIPANDHLDWTIDQGATNIHPGNYTDTNTTDHTLLSNIGTNTHAQIDTHLALTNAHLDWTLDQGATNIHPGNYTDTDTTDHTLLSNIGTNTHAQIDTHLALTNAHIDWTIDQGATNLHPGNYTDTDTTDHTLLSNIGTNTHAQIDTHIAEHIDWTGATQDLQTDGGMTVGQDPFNTVYDFIPTVGFEGGMSLYHWGTDAFAPGLLVTKSRAGGTEGHGAVVSGDGLFTMTATGSDGSSFNQESAYIYMTVDGAVATNSVPGRITFGTTPVGSRWCSERMRITDEGDVGIGSTAPGAKLHVVDDNAAVLIQAATASTASYLAFSNSAGTDKPLIGRLSGANDYLYYRAAGSASGHLWQAGGSSEVMRLTPQGNLGVGTGTPTNNTDQTAVTIEGTTYGRVDVWNTTDNAEGTLYAGGGAVTLATENTIASANVPLRFSNAGGELARFTSDGDFVIGTTSTASKFKVQDSAQLVGEFRSTGATACQISFAESGTTSNAHVMVGVKDNNELTFTAGASERMRIDSSGYVGINNTNPASTLDIINNGATYSAGISLYGTATAGSWARMNFWGRNSGGTAYDNHGFVFHNGGTQFGLRSDVTGGQLILDSNSATSYITFKTGGSETMRLKSSGVLNLSSLPTSSTGLSAGDLWNNSGVVNIV